MEQLALVTGSLGFVGRHLIPKLRTAGYEVIGLDVKEYGPYKGTSVGEWINNWGKDSHFDLVVHLAANIESVDDRIKKGGVNAYGDIALDFLMAKYLEETKPRLVIWPTSCAVDYPEDPYAFSKIAGEKFFTALNKTVPTVILRPYSGYGGDQALSYPFPAILNRAKNRENPLTVWGSGDQARDFISIHDLTDAFIHAIDHFPRGTPVPVGTGRATTFKQLARMMADAVEYDTRIVALSDKSESSPYRVADTTLAESCGWKAKIPLEMGIRMALEGRG